MTKANFDMGDDFVKGAVEKASAHRKTSADNLVMLNTRVQKELRDRVKLASVQNDTSMTAIVAEALENWLKSNESAAKLDAFADDDME